LGLPRSLGAERPLSGDLPESLQTVLANTQPLKFPRKERLPLLVLPISNALNGISDVLSRKTLSNLNERGIGYTVNWNPGNFEESLAEGLRIGSMQQTAGLEVAVNANACLYSFFDGSRSMLHIDESGNPFAETSFGGKLGCPFTYEPRYLEMKERIEAYLREYQKAGIEIDFVFADWEIDGPIEWNDAWDSSKRCLRCREKVRQIDDFRVFQKSLRDIRSEMQRVVFGDNVTSYFPEALVGNYGVYPHDGYRYWYDYFERETPGLPFRRDQNAKYREWVHEFPGTGYTFAMPVVYTWYPIHDWYEFTDSDFRWFYNMLLVGSNSGKHTPSATPLIPFVHWTTTASLPDPDPGVKQFSRNNYQALLWHLLLRGHDTFFLWCPSNELAEEVSLVHEVYSATLEYRQFLDEGTPVTFEVPRQPSPVVSGLRLGHQVLTVRTEFGDEAQPIPIQLSGGDRIVVPPESGPQILEVQSPVAKPGFLEQNGRLRFPIGFYELPQNDDDLQTMADAGVNIVRCGNTLDLARAHKTGMMGWISLGVQQGATDGLRQKIASVVNHPALAVWEGPDEIIWTFTAYSFLKEHAGFTREDWNNQTPKAMAYAQKQGNIILPGIREGIELVREMDQRNLPFWINEAADSDVKFSRAYMDSIDITGCDYYAVRSTGTDLPSIGRLVDRWHAIGRGKPVWMVLQAFSWHVSRPDRDRLYPDFHQSRFMAYDAIVHGGKGLFYWGSSEIDDPDFRTSLYALTSEIASIEPFLIGEEHQGVQIQVIDDLFDPPGHNVLSRLFRHGSDFLLILVNEDAHRHLGVDVTGLDLLEGRQFRQLYGSENPQINKGGFVTRIQGFEVKVFTTDSQFVAPMRNGRVYGLE